MAATKWTNAKVNALSEAGRYSIGDGLSLRVHVGGGGKVSKRWLHKISRRGKTQEVALGRWPEMRLDDARAAALENRARADAGSMPKEHRAQEIAAAEAALAEAQKEFAATPTIADMIQCTFEWALPT